MANIPTPWAPPSASPAWSCACKPSCKSFLTQSQVPYQEEEHRHRALGHDVPPGLYDVHGVYLQIDGQALHRFMRVRHVCVQDLPSVL